MRTFDSIQILQLRVLWSSHNKIDLFYYYEFNGCSSKYIMCSDLAQSLNLILLVLDYRRAPLIRMFSVIRNFHVIGLVCVPLKRRSTFVFNWYVWTKSFDLICLELPAGWWCDRCVCLDAVTVCDGGYWMRPYVVLRTGLTASYCYFT